ncbi:MAG: hypothetical protein KG075_07560 [Alphaproteobacteria bacterium]|nr:hypothetical protein [Alphaproteobacteria bacterium]
MAKTEAKSQKYRALSTLHGVDKKPTPIGAVVELDEDTAADLLAAKVIELVAPEQK